MEGEGGRSRAFLKERYPHPWYRFFMPIIGQLAFVPSPKGSAFQSIIGTNTYAIVRNLNNTSPTQSWVLLNLTSASSILGTFATYELAVNSAQSNAGTLGQVAFIPCSEGSCYQSILGPPADSFLIIRNMGNTPPVSSMVAVSLGGASSIIGSFSGRMAAMNACQVIYNSLSV